jgi:hypothetical protein
MTNGAENLIHGLADCCRYPELLIRQSLSRVLHHAFASFSALTVPFPKAGMSPCFETKIWANMQISFTLRCIL